MTIGENTFALDEPFLVMATQNPIEQEGTYPLPEAQVDRFLLKVVIGYPSREEEKLIIRQNISRQRTEVRPLLKPQEILDAQKVVEQIYIDEKIERYIVDIVFATRFPADYNLNDLTGIIAFGASPRASISLARASRAYAFLRQRGFVVPEDVRAVCHDVLRHRIWPDLRSRSQQHHHRRNHLKHPRPGTGSLTFAARIRPHHKRLWTQTNC